MPGLDKIVSDLLGRVRVVDPSLQQAVFEACAGIWPDIQDDDVLVGGFRAGTLNVLLDSHARLAEAKNFAAEQIRERINEILAADHEARVEGSEQGKDTGKELSGPGSSRSLDHARRMASPSRRQPEGNYVARIHFYLRGTK